MNDATATCSDVPGTREDLTTPQWLALALGSLLAPALLLGLGGDPRWWPAWTLSAMLVATALLTMQCVLAHPGLMTERRSANRAEGVAPWDRTLSPLMALSASLPLLVVAGLDHRFAASPQLSAAWSAFGLVLFGLGSAVAILAVRANAYFSSMVRIQHDRGHQVCDSGPYRIVRHPGYAGTLLTLPGIVLALGALWATLPALFALAVTLRRTALEDRLLQQELPGYGDYAARVRWRLLPGVY